MPIPTRPALPFVTRKSDVTGDVDVRLDPRFLIDDGGFEDRLIEEVGKLMKRPLTDSGLRQLQAVIGKLVDDCFTAGNIIYDLDGPGYQPQLFKNECDECVYLGRNPTKDADLFYCGKMMRFIVNWGDAPHQMRPTTAEEHWLCGLLQEEKK